MKIFIATFLSIFTVAGVLSLNQKEIYSSDIIVKYNDWIILALLFSGVASGIFLVISYFLNINLKPSFVQSYSVLCIAMLFW